MLKLLLSKIDWFTEYLKCFPYILYTVTIHRYQLRLLTFSASYYLSHSLQLAHIDGSLKMAHTVVQLVFDCQEQLECCLEILRIWGKRIQASNMQALPLTSAHKSANATYLTKHPKDQNANLQRHLLIIFHTFYSFIYLYFSITWPLSFSFWDFCLFYGFYYAVK